MHDIEPDNQLNDLARRYSYWGLVISTAGLIVAIVGLAFTLVQLLAD